METGFERLRLMSETIANMEHLGFTITSDIAEKRKRIEDEVIENELLPMLLDQVEPVFGWFSKNFTVIVDYDAEKGLEVKLTQKRRITDVIGSQQPQTTAPMVSQTLSQKRTAGYSSPKSPSPDAYNYASKVQELKYLTSGRPVLTWKEICDSLKIDVAGDSARRRLKKWVEENHRDWPKVPDVNEK
jgi:hypothetical protein